MALIDAIANSIDVPLWRLFGGFSNSISSAVTVKSPPHYDLFIFIFMSNIRF